MARRKILVCYDISSGRSRSRVADELARWGYRIQKSVFLIRADRRELKYLRGKLRTGISSRTDTVLFVPLCGECTPLMREVGKRTRPRSERASQRIWIVV